MPEFSPRIDGHYLQEQTQHTWFLASTSGRVHVWDLCGDGVFGNTENLGDPVFSLNQSDQR